MDLNSVRIPKKVKAHLLRHFEKPSVDILEAAKQYNVSNDLLHEEMSMPSSRFFSSFAGTPEEVLGKMNDFGFSSSKGINGNIILSSTAPASEYPAGIGNCSIIHKDELMEDQQQYLYTANNRGYPLNHLKVINLPFTREITAVILNKPISAPTLITLFPGPSAMPIPDHSMSRELFIKCKNFWDEHVFLVSSRE
jgi:hypothetical protein